MHNYLANWRVQKFTRHSGNTAPWFVTYELTYLCNLRCAHCYATDFDPRPQEDLSTEDAKHIVLDQVVGAGTYHLTFMGGEPMIRKDVYELIAYARKLGAFVKLQTNGTLLTPEAAKRLDEADVNQVEVSIEGIDAKTNDLVRGHGSFKRAIEGLQNLAETRIPKKGICFTVTTNNFHQLDDVPRFAKELDVDEVFFSKFYVKGRGSKHPEWALTREQREKLRGKIGDMQRGFPGMPLFAIWNCEAGNKFCVVSPRGEVRPCTLHDQVVGDLKIESFTKIWRESPVFDQMRRPYAYKEVCGGCNYKYQCLGTGCPARIWHNKKEIIEEECVLKEYGER